jgi:hypothetical protein
VSSYKFEEEVFMSFILHYRATNEVGRDLVGDKLREEYIVLLDGAFSHADLEKEKGENRIPGFECDGLIRLGNTDLHTLPTGRPLITML